MDRDLHDLDDLFRKAISEHEDTPSAAVWDKLDKDLDKRTVISISRKYNKLKWVAASLFIFSSAVAMYTWKMKSDFSNLKENTARSKLSRGESDRSGIIPSEKSVYPEAASSGDTVANFDGGQPTAKENTAGRFVPAKQDAIHNLKRATKLKPSLSAENPGAKTPRPDLAKTNTLPASDARRNKASLHVNDTYVASKSTGQVKANTKNKLENKTPGNQHAAASSPAGQTLTYRQKEDKRLLDLAAQTRTNKETRQEPIIDISTGESASFRRVAEAKDIAVDQQPLSKPAALTSIFKKVPSGKKSGVLSPAPAPAIATAVKLSSARNQLFTLTPFYSLDYVSSRVNNDLHLSREFNRKEIKDKEEISQTHSMGLLVGYLLTNNLSIESGLILSSMTTSIKPKTIFAQKDNLGNVNFRFNCSAGYSVVTVKSSGPTGPRAGDSIQALSSSNTLKYTSVPINFRYRIAAGKLSFNPGIGLAANFLSSGKIQTQIATSGNVEKMMPNRMEGLNSMYLSGSLSLGMSYSFSKAVAFTLLPAINLGMSSINKDTPVKTVLNRYGIGAGLTFSL